MVKEIIKDEFFLKQKSKECTKEDTYIAQELLETIQAYKDQCVGMAANMIGVSKRIIAISDNGKYILMFNPEIVKAYGEYETEEGCLSLDGERKTKRYKTVTVKYANDKFKTVTRTFTNFTAQIIQHEIDHCNGILI